MAEESTDEPHRQGAKALMYEEFIEVELEAPKHLARGPTVVQ